MTYITKLNTDTMRATYNRYGAGGNISDFAHSCGVFAYSAFYWQMEHWMVFADSIIPDWWPMNTVQDVIFGIIRAVHDRVSQGYYDEGVHTGLYIEGQVRAVLDSANAQINRAVSDMRDKIDRDIVTPLRDRINMDIKPTLDQAQKDVANLKSNISSFNNDLKNMKIDVSSASQIVKDTQQKANELEGKLNDKARELDGQLRDFENRMGNLKTTIGQIEDFVKKIDERVKALEGKGSVFEIPRIFQG